MIRPDVTPDAPVDEQPAIGLIGMGVMGRMYAQCLSAAGWKKINVCDIPEAYDSLRAAYKDTPGITALRDGHNVSRASDFIVYSVEAEFIDKVVAQYGPCKFYSAASASFGSLDGYQLQRSGLSSLARRQSRHQSAQPSSSICQQMCTSSLAILCMVRLFRRRTSRWYVCFPSRHRKKNVLFTFPRS